MNPGLVLHRSREYARAGAGFGGALLKHSLVPLGLLRSVLPERGLVLDLGCGEGMLANLLARSRPGLRVLGVDRDAARVALASRAAAPNARFEMGDVLEHSLPRAAAVIFNDVLHHHPPRRQAGLLARAAASLDQDGVLVVKEVDARDRFDRAWTSFWDRRLYPADALNFRDAAGWRSALFDAGFEVLGVHRVCHPWPASRTVLVCRRRQGARLRRKIDERAGGNVKVLVTGGTGFIGRHLVRRLKEDGLDGQPVEVSVLTRDRTRLPAEIDGACRVVVRDIEVLTADDVRDADYVFHLAADKDFFGGRQVFANNVRGTQRLIEVLQGSPRLKRLVFASSMGAIDRAPADDCMGPITEDSPPHPSSPYGRAKLECERLIAASSLPFSILRLPWCYGAGMTATTHVRALTASVLRGGIATRFDWPGRVSLLEVGECARALAWAATAPGAASAVLFVSDGAPISLGALFRHIGQTVGRPAGGISVPAPVVGVARLVRRLLPLTVRSLFLDVLWVDDSRLRRLGFEARPRGADFLLPLARFVSDEVRPSLRRSTALVTGAASGIGRAIATQLAARARTVVMVDRDSRVAEVASRIPGAEACVADLCEAPGLAKVLSRIEAGDVNWVVNCAGIGARRNLGDGDPAALGRIVATNVHALTQLSEAAMRQFHEVGEGLLVNVASSSALQPLPGMAAYAASKAYVLSFSEAVAAECVTSGIAVVTVCPSGVATRFQESAGVRRSAGERLLEPATVAMRILDAGEAGRSRTLFVGSRTRWMAVVARILPRGMNARLWKRLMDSQR